MLASCAVFQHSNVRDEPHINLCGDNGGKDESKKDESKKLIESQTGMHCEINSDRGDFLVRDFWDRITDCIKDVRIYDVNQAFYLTRKSASIIKYAENEKKEVFGAPPRAEKALYTLYCLLLRFDCKGNGFISMKLAEKWHWSYSQTVSFVKTRFAISLVRAKNRCLRGSRIPTGRLSHRVTWKDGTEIGLHSTLE